MIITYLNFRLADAMPTRVKASLQGPRAQGKGILTKIRIILVLYRMQRQ